MSKIIAVNDVGKPRHLQKKSVVETEAIAYLDGEFYAEAFQCREMMDGRSVEIPGTRRVVVKNNHNILLDNALEAYGRPLDWATNGYYNTQFGLIHLGTGSTVEQTSNTALEQWVAAEYMETRNGSNNYSFASGSAPYWGARRAKARFEPNFAGGSVNLSEMGVSDHGSGTDLSQANTLGYLTSRALIRDGNGDPTTVSVLDTEYLDVWYTRRLYPGLIIEETGAPDDKTGSVLIDGISYGYTVRPGLLGSSSYWGRDVDYPFSYGRSVAENFSYGVWGQYPSTLGAVTSGISAADDAGMIYSENHRMLDYVGYSNNRTVIYSTSLDGDYNWPTGIGGIQMETRMGTYQLILDAGVPKTNQNIFEWYCNFSWARKII